MQYAFVCICICLTSSCTYIAVPMRWRASLIRLSLFHFMLRIRMFQLVATWSHHLAGIREFDHSLGNQPVDHHDQSIGQFPLTNGEGRLFDDRAEDEVDDADRGDGSRLYHLLTPGLIRSQKYSHAESPTHSYSHDENWYRICALVVWDANWYDIASERVDWSREESQSWKEAFKR